AGMAHAVVAEEGAARRIVGAVPLLAIGHAAAAGAFDDHRARRVTVAILRGVIVTVIGAVAAVIRPAGDRAADQRTGRETGDPGTKAAAAVMVAMPMLSLRGGCGEDEGSSDRGCGHCEFRHHGALHSGLWVLPGNAGAGAPVPNIATMTESNTQSCELALVPPPNDCGRDGPGHN